MKVKVCQSKVKDWLLKVKDCQTKVNGWLSKVTKGAALVTGGWAIVAGRGEETGVYPAITAAAVVETGGFSHKTSLAVLVLNGFLRAENSRRVLIEMPRGLPVVFVMHLLINIERKVKHMPNYRVSLGFAQFSDSELSDCYNTVYNGLDGSTSFTNLPITLADFQGLGTTYITKLAAAADGGKIAIAAKNVARVALIEALRLLASYVQTVAGTNLPLLLSSGFLAVSINTAQTPLPKPVVDNIDNLQSTMLLVRLKGIPNAKAVEVRRKLHTASAYEASGIFTQLSRIKQEDLVPGSMYDLQFRAIGGSTGYSDWSDPISHLAT